MLLFLEQHPDDGWQKPWLRPKWDKRLARGLIYARLLDAGIDDAVFVMVCNGLSWFVVVCNGL